MIDALTALLRTVAKGEIVDRLIGHAADAKMAADEDDRLESLAKFLHVAQESDDFGFDVLGHLSPYPDAPRQPLLLEVKNASDRSFPASTAEWRRAEQQGGRYAFLVYLRGAVPRAELIPHPAALLSDGQKFTGLPTAGRCRTRCRLRGAQRSEGNACSAD